MSGASQEVKCASSAEPRAWTREELEQAKRWVGKLQRRIAKAQREKRYNKAKALQHLLVTSRAAKITAVERVTSNKGKRTAGVDGVTWQTKKVNLVRYADDFIVTTADKETLLEIKAMLTAFLAERGLELSEEKTLITHITEGFDFLGFNIQKYNGKLIIKPSKKSQERFVEKLHETIFRWNKTATQEALIDMLNPILRGWANYNRHVCSKEVFCKIDHIIVNQLMRWGYRRHPRKKRHWTNRRYFISDERNRWTFGFKYTMDGEEKTYRLLRLADVPIVRHVKVRADANPFDPAWDEYFAKRADKANRQRKAKGARVARAA